MEISSVQNQAMANNQAPLMEQVMLSSTSNKSDQNQERKPSRPHPEQSLKCPRCDSTNTKFCYYNNYSLSQPRYFCKGCRRYWTQGGSLRNVPVGGGCRKNKRSSSSSKKPESTPQTLIASNSMASNPLLSYPAPSHDLTLAPLLLGSNPNPNPNFLDILRSGFLDSANPEGFSNLCSYGFDGGLGLSSTATTTTVVSETGDHESKMMMMGHQWQLNDANNSNVGVDSARDYWSGGVGYNWQGIINSSLM